MEENPAKTQNDFIESSKHSYAARFAEWIEENHWWRSTDTRFPETLGRWTTHINGDVPLSKTKTTSQLLTLFNEYESKKGGGE